MCWFISFWVLRVEIWYWSFGIILELHFPKRAPKVCAPHRHTSRPHFSEISILKTHFRQFFDQFCAWWVHILGHALFGKYTSILDLKHISIPASNSQNRRSYGLAKMSSFGEKWPLRSEIVGKSAGFLPSGHFWKIFAFLARYGHHTDLRKGIGTRWEI